MNEKIELLKKIKTLAEQGAEGERENAKCLLEKLLKKYNLSEDILNDERKGWKEFRFKNNLECKLLIQIIYKVTNGVDIYRPRNANTNRPLNSLKVFCTTSQKVEIDITFAFYKIAIIKELDTFFYAFCIKNNIFAESKQEDAAEPSEQEIEAYEKAYQMARGMKEYKLIKCIEDVVA